MAGKVLSNEQFLARAHKIHKDTYNYTETQYRGRNKPITVICRQHGKFSTLAGNHLQGAGCYKCGLMQLKSRATRAKKFMTKAKKQARRPWDYSKVEYKNEHTPIILGCPDHGYFKISPKEHLRNGGGCKICWKNQRITQLRISGVKRQNSAAQSFVEKALKIHNYLYSYPGMPNTYEGALIPTAINCPKHGVFYQSPSRHLQGCGCPICNNSKGEMKIASWLDQNNILYISQLPIVLPNFLSPLRFDFYIPSINTGIEYDGEQHTCVIKRFGGKKALIKTQRRDKAKARYCRDNDIRLIRISYKNFNQIEEILKTIFKNL